MEARHQRATPTFAAFLAMLPTSFAASFTSPSAAWRICSTEQRHEVKQKGCRGKSGMLRAHKQSDQRCQAHRVLGGLVCLVCHLQVAGRGSMSDRGPCLVRFDHVPAAARAARGECAATCCSCKPTCCGFDVRASCSSLSPVAKLRVARAAGRSWGVRARRLLRAAERAMVAGRRCRERVGGEFAEK
jgi:hypothetical protein